MPSYRFCRPDDIPLLVKAVNEVYNVHFPEEPECTLSSFKDEVRELNLWSSSCMIALEGKQIIGVCIGCKREQETLIYKVGVHPDFQRQGHGRHLLTSLRQKLSVLGPKKIVVEVPEDNKLANNFFISLGYKESASYADFQLQREFPLLQHTEIVQEITYDQLLEQGVIKNSEHVSWLQQSQTLLNLKKKLFGLAVVSVDGIEAYILYIDKLDLGEATIFSFGCNSKQNPESLLHTLLCGFNAKKGAKIHFPKVSLKESWYDSLGNLKFQLSRKYVQYVALATD